MDSLDMKTCGGCDGSLSDRQDSSVSGRSGGIGEAKVQTVGSQPLLNPGGNPARTMPGPMADPK